MASLPWLDAWLAEWRTEGRSPRAAEKEFPQKRLPIVSACRLDSDSGRLPFVRVPTLALSRPESPAWLRGRIAAGERAAE